MGRKRRPKNMNSSRNKTKKKVRRKNLQYAEEAMLRAVQEVHEGKSIAQAAKDAGVPRITLHYKARGKRPLERSIGRPTVLTNEEEARVVNWIITSSRLGFPVTKNNLKDSVQRLIEQTKSENTFTNNRPGRAWYESFMKRHPEVAERVPQNLTSSRSKVSSTDLIEWSDTIAEYLTKNDWMDILYDPTRLFNGDESAFFLNPKGSAVLAARGDKTVYQTVNADEKECITVLITANAAGVLAPPLIVFKYERVPLEIANSVPDGWAIGKSDSGWMNGGLFYEFITNSFHPWLLENNVELPVIFFLDGHVSHLNLQTADFCHENGIILVALYPNATHLIQPMDVAVFRSVKGAWRQKVHDWRLANLANPTLKKRDFAPLLKEVLDSIDPTIISNGFRKCGLHPWNANAAISSLQEKEKLIQDSPINELPSSILNNRAHAHALEHVENFLGQQKLNFFQVCAAEGLNVSPEDLSLFQFWKETRRCLTGPLTPNSAQGTPESSHPVISEISQGVHGNPKAQRQVNQGILPSTSSIRPGEDCSSNHDELSSEKKQQAHSEAQGNTALLPSPFKRAFIYPERGQGIASKSANTRKRELFPSVISSQAWRDYHANKAKKKLDLEVQKKERAMERQRKKTEKEELQKKKKEERDKKKNISTRRLPQRATRRKKKVLSVSSSESEEWDLSDEDVDMVEEHPKIVGEVETSTAEILLSSVAGVMSNVVQCEAGDNTSIALMDCGAVHTSAEPMLITQSNLELSPLLAHEPSEYLEGDEIIINSIFDLNGLDIDPQEFTMIEKLDRKLEREVVPTVLVQDSECHQQHEAMSGKTPGCEEPGRNYEKQQQKATAAQKEEIRKALPIVLVQDSAEHLDNEAMKRKPKISEEDGRSDEQHKAPAAAQDDEIKASEVVGKETEAFLEEGSFIVAKNFNKNTDAVKLVCRVISVGLDGCDVVIMKPISRMGSVYKENLKDIRKIQFNQILKVLPTPRKFGSNFQFLVSDMI